MTKEEKKEIKQKKKTFKRVQKWANICNGNIPNIKVSRFTDTLEISVKIEDIDDLDIVSIISTLGYTLSDIESIIKENKENLLKEREGNE